MKRILSILVAALMSLSFATVVLAAESTEDKPATAKPVKKDGKKDKDKDKKKSDDKKKKEDEKPAAKGKKESVSGC